ncbi:MAG: GTP cyclohydrolase [Acidobacteria bacterium]|nr:GTP cyclohydrolase [Acidobacteriota bacterium]
MNIRLAERELHTKFGVFTEILFYDGQAESIALLMGDVSDGENILCRIHSSCISGHVFNSVECECANEMAAAQSAIQEAGRGVIIYLDQEGKGNGHLALMKSIPYKKAGHSQGEAYELAGYEADARSFRPAAEILSDLGIGSVVLITNNPEKAEDLRRFSITVSETKEMTI